MLLSLIAQAEGGGSMSHMFILLLATVFIFYFMIMKPQKKQQEERQAMLGRIKKHDRVLTSGGIWGTVVAVKDNEVVLRVDDDNNVRIRFAKSAVLQVGDSGSREGQGVEGAEAGTPQEKK